MNEVHDQSYEVTVVQDPVVVSSVVVTQSDLEVVQDSLLENE